ncbi:hypothetical protein F2Q70_00008128 [Brassica cretica]|uniref:Uncharacterized protein n=1 Tax=Brassica cretica TaxID=69181 RepID=A0A8S9M2C4_BRACR|nr:hypothetical protein F2Q70_00008128 [Brassica cretica]
MYSQDGAVVVHEARHELRHQMRIQEAGRGCAKHCWDYVNARSYEAEVMFEEAENAKVSPHTRSKTWPFLGAKCSICSSAAVMSNRNERAPDGLVVDAHLSDGFLHLILIKDCSRPKYLWHLTELAKKGGEPLNFESLEMWVRNGPIMETTQAQHLGNTTTI